MPTPVTTSKNKKKPPPADVRLRVLKAMRVVPHRYDAWRAFSMTVSLAILAAVPLLGVARVDVWGGQHYLLMRPAVFKHALGGVIIGIAAMYVVTFLSNVVAGRMFCGWGCPVGQVSRFGEAIHVPGLKPRQRWRKRAEAAAFIAAFVVSTMAWWVDLAVLWRGSPAAMAWAWATLAVGLVGGFAHARWWRWEFCKTACPIGLYYTFVSPSKWFGVHFRNQDRTCIECDACDHVCPVDLLPRELMTPIPARGGVSISDAPGRNHCLECGDCIRACERMVSFKGIDIAPLHLGYFNGPQRVTPDDVASPTTTPDAETSDRATTR